MTGRPSVTAVRALSEVDIEAWNALFPARGFYAASPWLRHAEATSAGPPLYLVARAGARWTGALPAYELGPDTPFVFCSPGHVIANRYREVHDEPAPWTAGLMPALACGGRNPSHTKVGGDDPVSVDALVHAAEEHAWSAGLRSVSFLYVDEDDSTLRRTLRQRGYVEIVGQTAYSLTVPADGGFEAYLATLDKRRRWKVKREERDLAAAGVSFDVRELTGDLIDTIAPLELALYAKHGSPADARAFRGVFESIAANTAGHARVATAEIAGRVVGFLLFFTYDGEFYSRQTGYDYDVIGELPVYFGLVYYRMVRLARAEGVRAIHYSTGSDRVKQTRGCRPRRQFAFVKTRDADVHRHLENLSAAQAEPR